MIIDQQIFLLFSILIGGFLSEHGNFYLYVNCLRNFGSADLQYKYFPLNISNPYLFLIFLYNGLLTPFICVLLSKILYYICFGQQRSCLYIGIAVLRYLVPHLLYIHKLIFDYINLYIHA